MDKYYVEVYEDCTITRTQKEQDLVNSYLNSDYEFDSNQLCMFTEQEMRELKYESKM